MKAPKDILTKDFLQEHYINQRKSVKTIKEELGLKSQNSVSQALKRHGLSRRSLKDSSHILTKDFLEEHYVRQNKSLSTIAKEIGFKRKSVVSKALEKHGITKREHTYSDKLKKHLKKRRKHPYIRANYFASIKSAAKKRKLEFKITIDEIWIKFKEQKGLCALSGVKLRFNDVGENKNTQTASLDRIDSNIGYTRDNIQWVHKDINKMKMDMDEKEFIYKCGQIYNYCKENKNDDNVS